MVIKKYSLSIMIIIFSCFCLSIFCIKKEDDKKYVLKNAEVIYISEKPTILGDEPTYLKISVKTKEGQIIDFYYLFFNYELLLNDKSLDKNNLKDIKKNIKNDKIPKIGKKYNFFYKICDIDGIVGNYLNSIKVEKANFLLDFKKSFSFF